MNSSVSIVRSNRVEISRCPRPGLPALGSGSTFRGSVQRQADAPRGGKPPGIAAEEVRRNRELVVAAEETVPAGRPGGIRGAAREHEIVAEEIAVFVERAMVPAPFEPPNQVD